MRLPRRNVDTLDPVLLVGRFDDGGPGEQATLAAFQRALPNAALVVAGPTSSWRDLTSVAGRCRAVVFAGGVVFTATPDASGRRRTAWLRQQLALAAYARAAGRRVAMVGVSAGDLRDGAARTFARRLARQADLLILRDDASAHALVSIGVRPPLRVGADPVWTLLDAVPRDVADTPLVISADCYTTIVAAAAGARVLTVSSDPSTVSLAHRLGQQRVPAGASGEQLRAAEAAALAGPPPRPAVVRAEIAAAEEGFGLLRLILSGGAMPAESISGLRLEPAW